MKKVHFAVDVLWVYWLLLTFSINYIYGYNYELSFPGHYVLLFTTAIYGIVSLVFSFLQKRNLSVVKLAVIIAFFSFLAFSNKYGSNNEFFTVVSCILLTAFFLPVGDKRFRNCCGLGFTITYLLQLLIGVVQLLLTHSLSKLLTGSLQNSGIYALFLSLYMPVVIFFIREKTKNAKLSLFYCVALVAFVFTIACINQARTSVIVIGFYAVIFGFSKFKNRKLVLGALFSALILTLLVYLGSHKELSGSGRMLSNYVVIKNCKEFILGGIGIGRTNLVYPFWQSSFFTGGVLQEKLFLSAGESYVIFNDVLQWIVELGLITSLLLFLYLGRLLKYADNKVLKMVLAATFISSITTYTFHVNIILLSSVLILSILRADIVSSARENYILNPPGAVKKSLYILLMLLLSFQLLISFKQVRFISHKESADVAENVLYYKQHEFAFRNDGRFLFKYATLLDKQENGEALEYLHKARSYFFNRETEDFLIDYYKRRHLYALALNELDFMSDFLPNIYYYKFERLKLYIELGDKENAAEEAKYILKMPTKVSSPKVDYYKAFSINLLKSYGNTDN